MTDRKDDFPKALPPPPTQNTLITAELIEGLVKSSQQSPRRRIILPLHKSPEANLHRMLNAMQPGSYIQPHRHLFPPKAESVIVLQGAIFVFIFTESGQVETVHTITAGSTNIGIDSEPGVYHTFLAIEEDTVLFEVKPGPYNQADDKDFAPWAPAEGAKGATEYMDYLYKRGNRQAELSLS
jgi:cupin fold WbuC family metalloprotein